MFKKYKSLIAALLTVLSGGASSAESTIVIGISQLIDHPALNETLRGIRETLARQPETKILLENAQGNIATASQIAQKFVGQKVQAIVAIGTSSAAAAGAATKGTTIPVFFATVTDPAGANLVKNLQQPEGHITGSSNFMPLKPQLELFQQLIPQLKKLGMIYNPGEPNGTFMLEQVTQIAVLLGIEIIPATANTTRDVAAATRNLVDKVQAIFISNDNTALSAFDTIIKIATESHVPVFVSDVDLVQQGAIAALGPNQYQVGVDAAQLILQFLQGKKISELPVAYPQQTEFVINKTQAQKIQLKIKDEFLHKASRVL